jgi:hypothetical protein
MLMNRHQIHIRSVYLAAIALLGWIALLLQLFLTLKNSVASRTEIIIRYFSYFTILTNLLVAVYCTICILSPDSKAGRFFSSPKTSTAITVYILIVSLVYNTMLRFLWAPTGLQKIVDELLHTVIPLLFILYWIIFLQKQNLRWKSVLFWLIYPVIYAVYVLIRGFFSGFYPYPFLNIEEHGFPRVLMNSIGLVAGFLVLSLFFVWISNLVSSRKK